MHAAAVGRADRQQDLVGGRGVRHLERCRDEVRAFARLRLVNHRHRHQRARADARVRERQERRAVHRAAEQIAEAQGVDDGRSMFDFTVRAHDSGFAVGLDTLAGHEFDQPLRHERAERRCEAKDLRAQILHETLAGPRVANHRGDDDRCDGRLGGLAAFAVGGLDEGCDLAKLLFHGCLLLRCNSDAVSCCNRRERVRRLRTETTRRASEIAGKRSRLVRGLPM
ncbi:hypothetical protein PCA31118_04941 [Pandoraea captiosa]|uniref:Uncharacterized protein n=1 Tax=Pandoraea captiosa TaxID=2508302 RepID=A0A5E5AQX4_9BURK|nr:hypothetical protein PCA31118_04941 [Pandoraea captiosa]